MVFPLQYQTFRVSLKDKEKEQGYEAEVRKEPTKKKQRAKNNSKNNSNWIRY